MDDLYTTGEFAKLCGVSKDTLFLYDQIGILKPTLVKRNGYRYYSTRQLFIFNQITSLNESGISLQEIKELFDNKSYQEYIDTLKISLTHLKKKQRHLLQSMDFLEQNILFLETIENYPNAENEYTCSNTALEYHPKVDYFLYTEPFDIMDPDEFTRKINETIQLKRRTDGGANINLSFTMDATSFQNGQYELISFCSTKARESANYITQEDGIYLTQTYCGNFRHIPIAFAKLKEYAESMNYSTHGNVIGRFYFLHQPKAKRLAYELNASKREDVTEEEKHVLEENERFEVVLNIIMKMRIKVTLSK